MQITRKIKIDIKKTVENSVGKNDDFHFFVDELTSENYMPTYGGMADEKYSFEEMNDEFFKFLYDKASQDGIYIRLIYASCMCSSNLNAIFEWNSMDFVKLLKLMILIIFWNSNLLTLELKSKEMK